MDNEKELIKSLIAGGIIGETLGAILTNGSTRGATIGGIALAAILATYEASQKAKASGEPHYIVEDYKLYKMVGEEKTFIKELEKPTLNLPKRFNLKNI